MHFSKKIKFYLEFMHFQQGITNVFGCNVQTDWRKYQLSKLNTHYIIRMTLNFTIDSIFVISLNK